MLLSDFKFDLPEELIAQTPAPNRRDSRLLVVESEKAQLTDRTFAEISDELRAGDLLVMNNTKVVPARLFGRKATGGRVEIMLERIQSEHTAIVQLKASKSPKPGSVLYIEGEKDHAVEVEGRSESFFVLRSQGDPIAGIFEANGHVPLPPYIRRADEPSDIDRYQTVYAAAPGAVAAPTAGLHFDEAMLAQLRASGVETGFVTLHVGAGTFQPVRSSEVESHSMHSERYEVSESLADQINQARTEGRRVVAVGTTSIRCLEAAYSRETRQVEPAAGETDIYLYPGKTIHVADGLLTNFHLPESTLIMLVAAFAGLELTMQAYQHAVSQRYRFFSYGDAMLLWR